MKKALSIMLTMCMVLSLFATFVISASAEATNLAAGKSYVTSQLYRQGGKEAGWGWDENAAISYPDEDGKSLTDGVYAPADDDYLDPVWAGFSQDPVYKEVGYHTITVDLGATANISEAVVYIASGTQGNGIGASGATVEVFVSDDNTNWTSVGTAEGAAATDVDYVALSVKGAASGRYVQFRLVRGGWLFVSEVAVFEGAAAVVEDKVINLLGLANTITETNCQANDLAYTWNADGAEIKCLGTEWPSITVKFNELVTIDVAKTYLEIEATVEGGNGTSIRLLGPVDDAGAVETDDIYLQHFDTDVTPDGGGDAPAGSTISYKLPVSELAYCIYDKANNYAGKNPITESEISFSGLQVFASGENCVVNITKLNLIVPGEAAAPVIKEVVTVDGDVNDTGWAKKGWTTVSGENGSWQYPTKKEVAAGTPIPTFTYKFQLRADDAKLYGALVLDGVHEEEKNIKVRVWFRDNDEATVYSSFYDFVLAPDGTLETAAKYNTSTTENKGAAIENTTLEAVAKIVDGKTVFEFSVALEEVTKDGNFDYFVSLERKQGVNTGTLYFPFIPEKDETSPHGNYPWLFWMAENDASVEVKDIVLGEIVVSDKEEADTSMMGTAPADPAFTVTLNTEKGWKAGEKLVVTATVDVLKDGVDLSQIMFNLFYDAADVEIVLPEELGAIITSGKDSWKEDSLFTLSVDGEYGVIECAPATTAEADVLKKGDKLVMTFEFTVKDEAEGLINFQLSNKGLVGYSWDLDAAEVAGAGSSLAVVNADNLGDTGIYVIAALALVALIGTAVVIKKRA